jgi:8-oxo-dGTP diphosphatase
VKSVVHVAVGVIVNANGDILIAKRPDNSHQGGLWEFPGGKVELGETLFEALKRELHEELAIDIGPTEPLIKIRHDYGDKQVLLDVHKVRGFTGKPVGNEGQPVEWVAPGDLHRYEFPAANRPIISAIKLPKRMLITGNFESVADCLGRVERALHHNIRLVQLRMADTQRLASLLEPLSSLCANFNAQLQVNCAPELFAINHWSKVGLHLNARELMQCQQRPVASNILLGASCHNELELVKAQSIGADYLLLSPVKPTSSHPGQLPMGWNVFGKLIEPIAVPVYALGGMTEADLSEAIAHGGQGIAAISEWWN